MLTLIPPRRQVSLSPGSECNMHSYQKHLSSRLGIYICCIHMYVYRVIKQTIMKNLICKNENKSDYNCTKMFRGGWRASWNDNL